MALNAQMGHRGEQLLAAAAAGDLIVNGQGLVFHRSSHRDRGRLSHLQLIGSDSMIVGGLLADRTLRTTPDGRIAVVR